MIKGAIASLVTPFASEGTLDVEELAKSSNRIASAGFDVLCFAGGTGEFLSLRPDEREQGLKAVIDGSNGTPVLAAALYTDPGEILKGAERYAKIGARAIMVMPPYFYAPTQDAIFDHLSYVGKEAALPVLLFNSAGRAGRVMTPETVLRLAEYSDNIIGVKETTEHVEDIERLVVGSPGHFQVIQAHEPLVLASYVLGATGSFGSLCNIIPRTVVKLHRALDANDYSLAREVTHQICRIARVAYSVTIPVGIKHIMNTLGISDSGVRLPLTMSLDNASKEKLSALAHDIMCLEGEIGSASEVQTTPSARSG